MPLLKPLGTAHLVQIVADLAKRHIAVCVGKLEQLTPPDRESVDALVAPGLIDGVEIGIKAREHSFT
ncbi:MAG: hypothetical protein WCD04_10285 [Terriglobia bacterium]